MGSCLKECRLRRNLTQSQLAAAAGVNIRIIQHYEQGSKDINKAAAATVYRLAKALNCRVEDLLDLSEDAVRLMVIHDRAGLYGE